MVDLETARQLALSFPESIEQDHFGHPSFRVRKKIFATLWPNDMIAVLKLNEVDQSVFSDFDRSIIYPVEGGWGKQGATKFELSRVDKEMFMDALTKSYCLIAPKSLADQVGKQ